MDNHKWALVAWEHVRVQSQRYALLHADFHWDGVDAVGEFLEALPRLKAADLQGLVAMTKKDKLVRFDSFIAAAVRRGFLSEVHFFCVEDNGNDEGLSEQLCAEYGVRQEIHKEIGSFAQVMSASPTIFDLCLDLFILQKLRCPPLASRNHTLKVADQKPVSKLVKCSLLRICFDHPLLMRRFIKPLSIALRQKRYTSRSYAKSAECDSEKL